MRSEQIKYNLEFKRFQHDNEYVTADMFINGEFIIRFTDFIERVWQQTNISVTLYTYFKVAAREYLSHENCNGNKLIIEQPSQNSTKH